MEGAIYSEFDNIHPNPPPTPELPPEGWSAEASYTPHRKGQHRQPDRGLIYFVEAVGLDRLKIGYTSGKIQARLAVIRTGSPVEIRPLLVLKDKAPQDEAALHRLFKPYRSHHEWYVAAPALVQYIADLCATKGDDQVQWIEHLDWLFKRKLAGSDKS